LSLIVYSTQIKIQLIKYNIKIIGGQSLKVVNLSKKTILCEKGSIANTFLKRLKGLMFQKNIQEKTGLLIKPCNSIHTFWMNFSIDVIFISKDNKVVYIIENLSPNKFSKVIRNSTSVLELPVGTIKSTNTNIGDRLGIEA